VLVTDLAVVDDDVEEGVHQQDTIRQNTASIKQHRLNTTHKVKSTGMDSRAVRIDLLVSWTDAVRRDKTMVL